MFVRKKPGQGYCSTHHYERSQASHKKRYLADVAAGSIGEPRAAALEADIRKYIADGHEMPPEMIQSLYSENGLTVPSIDQIEEMYYPKISSEDFDARLRAAQPPVD